jgi:adenylate cyclase
VADDNIVAILRGLGVTDDEIERARKEGTAALVALYADHGFVPGKERLTRLEVAERAGIALEEAQAFWRSLGFADVGDDEAIFTEADVEVLKRVKTLIDSGVIDRDLALQMTRVMGRATAQIAAAQLDTARRAVGAESLASLTPILSGAPGLIDDLEKWIVHIWRRHFAAEVKRAAMHIATGEEDTAVVGFADLVGFTGISQQMDEAELAAAVSRFETIAVEVVGRHDGRVVKMIGDEVMFEAIAPKGGADIALDLVDAIQADDTLPDVRVGLAWGPASRNQGDLFGTAPNLASRLVDEAYPSSVLVSDSIHDALAETPGYAFKGVRPRNLKGFGRTRYWVLRREGAEDERPTWKIAKALPIELPEIPFLERSTSRRASDSTY